MRNSTVTAPIETARIVKKHALNLLRHGSMVNIQIYDCMLCEIHGYFIALSC